MNFKYVFLALVAFSVPCCSIPDNNSNQAENSDSHVVSFYTYGGSFVKSQVVGDGKLATKPEEPTKEDCKFLNWYTTNDFQGEPFNFNEPIIHDLKLYAKWEENFFWFTFQSYTNTCKVHDNYLYQEKVNKYRNDVRFVVKADEGNILEKIDNLPKGVSYDISEDKKNGLITIYNMNGNYSITAEAIAESTATFTFDGGGMCQIDGEDNVSKTFTVGEVNKVLYIKPLEKYNIPTEEELNIECSDISKVNYKYENGVLTLKSMYTDFKIKPHPSHQGYKVFAYSNNSEFTIENLGQTTYKSMYNGVITKDKLYDPTSEDRYLGFSLKLDSDYDIDNDHIFAQIDGTPVHTTCECDTSKGENYYRVTVQGIDGDLVVSFRPKLKDYKTITVDFVNESKDDPYDLYFDGKYVSDSTVKVDIPTSDSSENPKDFFLPLEVRTNDNTLRACSKNGVQVKIDSSDTPVQVFNKEYYNNTETCLSLINFKGVDKTLHVILKSDPGVKRILNYCSFNVIDKFSESPDPSKYVSIGDRKKITLIENGVEQNFQHEIQVIGFKHDKIYNVTGKTAGITFDFVNLLTKNDGTPFRSQFNEETWYIGYDETKYRKYLDNFSVNNLPSDLYQHMKRVDKRCHVYFPPREADYVTVDCNLFPLCLKEINVGEPPGCDIDYNEEPPYEFYVEHTGDAEYFKKKVVPIQPEPENQENDFVEDKIWLLRTIGDQFMSDHGSSYFVDEDGKVGDRALDGNYKLPCCPGFSI